MSPGPAEGRPDLKQFRSGQVGPYCPDRIAVRALFPIPMENCIMPYASVNSWGIRNTMKAGRRHGRSTRPSLEAMEERTLLTAPR